MIRLLTYSPTGNSRPSSNTNDRFDFLKGNLFIHPFTFWIQRSQWIPISSFARLSSTFRWLVAGLSNRTKKDHVDAERRNGHTVSRNIQAGQTSGSIAHLKGPKRTQSRSAAAFDPHSTLAFYFGFCLPTYRVLEEIEELDNHRVLL